MRLEKIFLDGFKSFADKTQFTFDSPVTAIVGPNGCGKSNIVDAVKWVLGEQSVKSLRSDQMADVIFGGSSSRKPSGSAEVSLFICDTTGQLPIETDQVQITRRIYKSGESEYRINNKVCRLRDVRELFMDTGVGTKAYSIIEQGQVEQLITASKTDRRIIFEEAAGISKYKAHKKEALRKLEYTEQNLLRVADILGEVTKRLRSVKLAASKARNYLQYTQRLKELQVNYSLAEFDKNHSEGTEKGAMLGRLEEQFAAIAAEAAKNELSISNLGQEIIETENRINRVDNAVVTVASRIEQRLQRIEFLRSRVTELQQRKASAEERVGKLEEQEGVFTKELAQYRLELQKSEESLEEKTRAVEQIQKTIQQIDTECASLEAELEDEKSGIIDIVRRTAQLHNEVQSIGVYRSNLSSQKDRLSNRAEEGRVELEKLLTEKAQYKARLGDIEKVLGELTERLEAKRKEAEEINGQIAADNRQLAASREAQSALAGELAVLTDMETRREGIGNGVKCILANRSAENGKFDYVEGILADIVAADVKYAAAVEAALEGKTDAVVINSTARLLFDMKTIEKADGRVNFLCIDKIEPFVDKKDLSKFQGVKGRIVEFVNYDGKHAPLVWGLLGKTIIVEAIDEAIKLAEKLGREYKFVTLTGEFYGTEGMIKIGPLGKTTGLISRKSRLRQLQQAIANTTEEMSSLEKQIEKNNQTSEHLTKLRKELRTAIYEANTEKTEISSKLANF
jgi:chromosome segregation protein